MTTRVLALSGGVGGAKLALGLYQCIAGEALTFVVNIGDDFEHLGLHVSPDIDTLIYTLAGVNNPETGWGREGETWSFMTALGELGGETWFQLGDKDLALNVIRTARLRAGAPLSMATAELARALGINATVAPITDDVVRTRVKTPSGWLGFQRYFVQQRCQPPVIELDYEGAAAATPSQAFTEALGSTTLEAIVLCPSNPYLSVDPMLAVPGVREQLVNSAAPVVAVSPIVGGRAIKGPTAKIMAELGIAPSALSVAQHYRGVIDGMVLDVQDQAMAEGIRAMGIAVTVADTVMKDLRCRKRLAELTIDFACKLYAKKTETTPNVGTGTR